jgi:predicted dienelactone hydrolase
VPTWRTCWLLSSSIPAFVALLQIALEGWRWQLVPLYLLAAVLPALALLGRKRNHPPARWLRWGGGIAMAGIMLGSAFLAGWLLPVSTLLAPTGPYDVGVIDRELVDRARDRRLMATVWYPAAAPGPSAPLTHYPDQLMAGMANLTGMPAIVFQHMRYIDVTASEGAPILVDGEQFPVLLFSHGMVGTRVQNASMLQDLASWGYVVLALDHTDAAAVTTFPDGETRFYDPTRFGLPATEAPSAGTVETNMFPVWVADQQFAFDTLEDWAENDPLFAGTLDLDHLGAFGHSFGGATSLEVCRIDERCRAAADLDGGLYGAMRHEPAVRPALLVTSAGSTTIPEAMAGWGGLLARADAPALWLELPGSSHLSFTDMEMLSPFLPPPGYDPRAGLAQVTHDLRVFFDANLRGQTDPDGYTLPNIGP